MRLIRHWPACCRRIVCRTRYQASASCARTQGAAAKRRMHGGRGEGEGAHLEEHGEFRVSVRHVRRLCHEGAHHVAELQEGLVDVLGLHQRHT